MITKYEKKNNGTIERANHYQVFYLNRIGKDNVKSRIYKNKYNH